MALTKITTSVVAVNSLTSANIADNSIDATKIANNQILARHIAADALSDQIADNAIGIAQLNVSDGSSGQALVTNGSGTLSFSTVAISGISSSADATAITIDSSENVGIGTSPTKRLTVGDSDATAFIASGGSNVHLTLSANGASGAVILRTGGTNGNPDTTTERMRIDSSGNVGIGVTTPTNYYSGGDNLVVGTGTGEGGITLASTGTGQWNYLLFADGTSGDAQYRGQIAYNHSADNMAVTSSGFVSILTGSGRSEKMRVDANGNLGLGDTSPANFSGYVVASLADSTGGIIDFKTTGSEGVFGRIQGVVNNQLAITNKQAYPLTFGTNDTERMRIDSSGNVGIGTTTPVAKLQVIDTAHIGNGSDYSSYSKLAVYGSVYQGDIGVLIKNDRYNDGAATSSLIFEHRTHSGQGHAAKLVCRREGAYNETAASKKAALDFYTATSGTNRRHAYLNHEGKFIVENNGGSTYSSYGKGSVLRVDELTHNQSATHYIEIGGNLPGYSAGQYNCLKTSLNDLHFAAGNTYTGYISYNTGFNDISDITEKENITTISNATTKLKQLRGVYHTWKDTENRGTDTHMGLIAQEVEAVVPEVVTTSSPGLKGVSYGKLVPLLIETIKELEARIATLEA